MNILLKEIQKCEIIYFVFSVQEMKPVKGGKE